MTFFEIVALIWEIVKFFLTLKTRKDPRFKEKEAYAELKAAIQKGRQTKDYSDLEALHDKYGHMCTDGVCKPK